MSDLSDVIASKAWQSLWGNGIATAAELPRNDKEGHQLNKSLS